MVANVTVAVCNKGSRYYWSWYCGQKNVARSLFTAVLPPLLLMLWQSLVMPNVLYRFAWVSHSQLVSQSVTQSVSHECGVLFNILTVGFF